MRRRAGLLRFLLLTSYLLPLQFLSAQDAANPNMRVVTRTDWATQPKYRPGEILVRFRPATQPQTMDAAHAAVRANSVKSWASLDGLQLVRLPAGASLQSAIASYRRNPAVLYAEPNYIVHALGTLNDPSFSQQWNLQNTGQFGGFAGADIHAIQAWTQTTGSANVVVAVIDTGIDYNHPDLASNVWTNSSGFAGTLNGVAINCAAGTHGFNAVAGSCDPLDDNGHGTHVSGTIGAVGNNSIGVVGVNWTVQILPCKFLDAGGGGAVGDAITCLDFVKAIKDSGVNVIASNDSWGGADFSQALVDAIKAQQQDGILFIAAAGNDFEDNDTIPLYPANYFLPNLISVAATDRFDDLAYFSDIGSHTVHIGAPGQEILSTTPNKTYFVLSGTSMAAPQVTGVAALLAAFNPRLDWRAIKNLILAGGDTLPSLASTVTGKRLDAYGSITCANSTVTSRLQPTQDALPGTSGQPITLAVLHINCAQPAGAVQVTVSPGGQTISLADNGTGPDQAAGDGIYSAQWVPPGPGNYTLTFPTGNPVQVTVLSNYVVGESSPSYLTIAGTNLNLGDDDVASVVSPFPIQFGGGAFSKFYVSSNGTISLTNAFGDYINLPVPLDLSHFNIPSNPPPPPEDQPVVTLLAPLWEDLFPVKGTSQNVFWGTTGTAPNRQLVVEWRNVRTFACQHDASTTVTFEVVFSEGSPNVAFNYSNPVFGGACADQDNGNAATIGMQINQNVGAQWSFDQSSVGSGMSLLWTIQPSSQTPNPVPTLTSISPSSIPPTSTGTVVTVTGTGFVPSTQAFGYPLNEFVATYTSSTQLQVLVPALDPSLAAAGATLRIYVANSAPGGGDSQSLPFTIAPQVPQIASTTPSSIAAGSGGFTLTLVGSGFDRFSDVIWNGPTGQTIFIGSTGQVTFINPNQISILVSNSLVQNSGTVTIQVQNTVSVFSSAFQFAITPNVAPAASVSPALNPNTPGSLAGQLNPTTTKLPLRFLGWNYALKVGGPYLDQLLKSRAKSGAQIQVSAPPAISHLPGNAQASAASTSIPGFNFRPTLPADSIPTAIVAGDFNGDGKMDWALANGGADTIWIYLGNGDGTTQLPMIVPLRGHAPVALAAADMNHDGILDLVVAEADSGMIAVLLGKGDGTFAAELQFAVPSPPISLAVADFDGDGNPDVVAGVLSTPLTGRLAFFHGDGSGKLGYPVFRDTIVETVYFNPISLSVADLDGDGRPDIVVLDLGTYGFNGKDLGAQDHSAGARVYLNQGNGVFKLSQQFYFDLTVDQSPAGQLGVAATALALGDVNKDGCIDAVALDTTGNATYFPGRCDGSFDTSNPQIFASGIVAGAAALVDLNGDGNLDLVSSGTSFADTSPYQTSDGNSISVQFGDGTGNFGSPALYRGESGMYSLAVADLNGDGRVEVLTANQSSDTMSVYVNDGKGAFGGPRGAYLGYLTGGQQHAISGAASQFVASVDVNGDGHKDLITIETGAQIQSPAQLTVLLGNGAGGFASPIRSPLFEPAGCNGLCLDIADFALEDFRNVGRPDLLLMVATGSGPSLMYSMNNGDGTFQKPVGIALPQSASNLFLTGDFNGDGKLDLAFLNSSGLPSGLGETVSIDLLLGNGDGTFTPGPRTSLGSSTTNTGPYLLTGQAADMNHDGKMDLLVVGNSLLSPTEQNALYEFVGNGDGTFQPPKLLFNNFSPYFRVVDLNHDGLPDIVEAVRGLLNPDLSTYPWQYQVFLGQPDGSFIANGSYGPYYNPLGAGFFNGTPDKPLQPSVPLLADFNGDGNLDIAVFESGVDVVPTYFGSVNAATASDIRILAGNGDGTFTPSSLSYGLGRFVVPELAVDVNGDNRADLVEINGYTSSYDVISAISGPTFAASLLAEPVVGTTGILRTVLAIPSSTTTNLQVSASDPNISIPAMISIPAGSNSVDTEFQIGSKFNPNRVFSFSVTLGTETHVAYGTQAAPSRFAGFQALLASTPPEIIPSQSTSNYGVKVGSTGGYSTTLQFSCQGLPVGASCQFGADTLPLGGNEQIQNSLVINTLSSVAFGPHTFTVVITDGLIEVDLYASFSVGDFTLSISPPSRTIGTSDYADYTLALGSLYGYTSGVQIACSGLPSDAPCPYTLSGNYAPSTSGSVSFRVVSQNAIPGTYTFTITGAAGPMVHSATAQLIITAGTFTGSVSSTSATISVGGSQTFNIQVNSVNNFQGQVGLSCTALPGINCQFAPSPVSVGPSLPGSSVLTVSIVTKPSMTFPLHGPSRPNSPGNLFPLVLGTIAAATMILIFNLRPKALVRVRQARILGSMLLITLTCWLLVLSSCSAGGNTASSGGGNGGGAVPSTSQVIVQGTVGGTTIRFGTISVTVP
jgi:subtilisin family serine protease